MNMQLLIDAESLHKRLEDPDLRVIDCRFNLQHANAGRAAYIEGHIPSAVFADLELDLSGPVGPATGRHPLPGIAALAATFSRLGISSNTEVVVYDDRSGALAARAWWLLRWLGHDNARVLDGGIAAWLESGYALDRGDIGVAAACFAARERAWMLLNTADIVAAGDTCASLHLVDARDSARFCGDLEPLDTVAGHIPGALNLPFSSSLNADGTWKRQEALQQIWSSLPGERGGPTWSVMCGSGVTACHLVLSALLAGLPEPRLYAGSWSEWIRDPGRQVATAVSKKA